MHSSISKNNTASDFNVSDFSIIVIEDDQGLNHLICKKLKKEGFVVQSALTGKEALDKVTGDKNEVLLLDFKLPDYTGKQLVEELLVKYGQAPDFIMMTGFGDEKIAVDIMKLGAKDYIIKEANFLDFFVDKVRKICNDILNRNKLRELENDLKKNAELLNETSKIALAGSWELNLEDGFLNWTETTRKIHEVDDNYIPDIHNELSFFPGNHADELKEAVTNACEKGIPFDIKTPFVTKTGKKLWVRVTGKRKILHDECAQLIGIFQDITEYISSQEKIKATNAQLLASEYQLKALNQQLQASEQQLIASNQQLAASEKKLLQTNLKLEERLKEINCLYKIEQLIRQYSEIDQLLTGIVKVIPTGWQYPDNTVCRVLLKGKTYETQGFKETEWIQSSDIVVDGVRLGRIDLYYLKEKPALEEGPFLSDERILLDTIAGIVGRAFDKINKNHELLLAFQQLQASEQQLSASNQQLIATEQQLRAANMELSVNEEELRASNEQLIAESKKLRSREKELNAVFNTAAGGMRVVDLDFKIKKVNMPFLRMVGLTQEEVIGKKCYDIFWGEYCDTEKCPLRILRQGKEDRLEIEIVKKRPDGKEIATIKTSSALKDDQENIIGIVEDYHDITERKNAEIELKTTNEMISLKNKISNSFVLAEGEEFYNSILYDILSALKCQYGYFGYIELATADSLICPSMTYEIWDKCEMPQKSIVFPRNIWSGIWGESLIRKKSIYKNDGLVLPKGHVQLKNALAVPILFKNKLLGQIAVGNGESDFNENHIAYLEDICNYISPLLNAKLKEQQFQKEILLAKERAEESDRLKSAFLANMSHEIRTPMNGILGFTDLLKEPGLSSDERNTYISIIDKSGQRMLNTIQSIIDISKIESGLENLLMSGVNLNERIDDLCDFFQTETKRKNIQFFISKNLPDHRVHIQTDKYKLDSILTNLIKNAIKYTHAGRIDFGYTLESMNESQFLKFYIKDTGIGIPMERQQAIFNRFEQADIEDRAAYQGSGLGLTIAKAYVEMLGGKIWLESKPGSGSTFYFTLPFQSEEIKNKQSEEKMKDHKRFKNQIKILIVEDEEDVIYYLQLALKDYCKEFLIAYNGNDAVEYCMNNPDIDLVLMDIKIPGMDGYEATRKIREFNKEVFIIAQTAYAQKGDNEKCLEAGCNKFISKPIIRKDFLEMIEQHFNLK